MSAPNPSAEEQRAELASVILRLTQEWTRALELDPGAARNALEYCRQRSRELQASARALGLGGIAHHLEVASAACAAPLDVARARSALHDVREITLQVRDEVNESARRRIDQENLGSSVGGFSSLGKSIAPPPLLTVHPSNRPRDAEEPASPPVRNEPAKRDLPADVTYQSARERSAPAEAPSAEAGLNVRVRTMFGLRAFGRSKEPAPRREPSGDSSVLGLGQKRKSGPAKAPPLLSSPLPPLWEPDNSLVERPAPARRVDREREDGRRGNRRPSTPPNREPSGKRRVPTRGGRNRSSPPAVGRWLAGFGAAGLAIIGVVAFVLIRRAPIEVPAPGPPASSTSSAAIAAIAPVPAFSAVAAIPKSRLLTDDEQFRSLLSQIHGHGGKESPELRGLLDEQATLQSQLLKAGKCEGQGSCAEWEKARGLLVDAPPKPIAQRRRPADPNVVLSWSPGLQLPKGLPVDDDPLVKRYFQQYAENRVGRETLQSMLFRCGAYRDLIRATMIRYDVPEGVLGLVLVESGCEPMARSPVGALGLFQFMPDSGRSYGLRIIDNVLDERLSATKSTEAGVRFLSDLYAKLGSWDLVFAAYNLGPFGLLARLHRAGDDVGFWDLVDADMLPDETAQYVPRIEALALILANLPRLRFAGLQMRSPEDTSDLEVTSGTRLSLIARAASTSLDDIRRLNRDILSDRVPSVTSGHFVVQVSASVVEQARETLEDLLRNKNDEDTCVPSSFDWGRQRFTPEMAEFCRKKAAAVDPAPLPH